MLYLITYVLIGWLLGVVGYIVTRDSEVAVGTVIAWPALVLSFIVFGVLVPSIDTSIKLTTNWIDRMLL